MFIAPMRSIVPSKSKPLNMVSWKCLRSFDRAAPRMPAPEVLSRGYQETAGAGRRIADDHVPAESRALAAERTQEREDALVDDSEHLARLERLEARPPEILVGPAALVLPFRGNAPLHLRYGTYRA